MEVNNGKNIMWSKCGGECVVRRDNDQSGNGTVPLFFFVDGQTNSKTCQIKSWSLHISYTNKNIL